MMELKEVDLKSFQSAKHFILNCLREQGLWIFKVIVLKSSHIQGLMLILSLGIAWIFMLSLLHFSLLFGCFECVTYLYVRYMSTHNSNIELIGISSWNEFCERNDKDRVNKFLIAVDSVTKDILATTEIVVFGNYKKVNEADGDLIEHCISVEVKRLFVSPSCRGTGLAQKMLDHVYEHVENVRKNKIFVSKIVVFCNALQSSVRKLYERNGFELSKQWDLPIFVGLSHTTLCFYEKNLAN